MGLGLIDRPIEIMFTETAVVIGITAVNLPFMVLTLQSVIEGIDRRSRKPPSASAPRRRHGCGVCCCRWPCRASSPAASSLHPRDERLCDAGAARRAALPDDGPAVYGQFAQQNNWPFGGAIAFILMAATLLLTTLSHILVQRRMRRG